MIGHIISLIWHYVLSCCCSVSSSSWFIYTCEFLLSFHFIIICDQRSVPTASPPDCPSTLASRKGKSWEIKSAVFKILCLWSECFKVYLDSMIIRSVNERCPCCGRGSACCKRAKNMIICSDLFYIIFFFHPFSCGKAVLFGKGVSRQVLLSPPMRCFYPTHTPPQSIFRLLPRCILHICFVVMQFFISLNFCLSDTQATKVLPRPKTFVCKKK